MRNIEKFQDFCLKVVILNNRSYQQYWKKSNFDDRIGECIAKCKKTFGKSFFEMSSSEISKLDFNLEPFKSYSDKQGSGIPKSIINKHYRLFLEFDKKMKFNDLQGLINFVHQTFQKENIYKNGDFINAFQKERIRLNGNSKVASSSKIFGDVREDYWTINIGAEKELQYHINISESQIQYGLGFNAQSSKNNTDPLSCVQPFVDSFFRNESLISGHLKGYSIDYIKDKLKSIKVGDFFLLGKSIEINNLDNGFEIEGLAFLEMLYNLANRQFEAYKAIFQSSKNNFNETKSFDMENKIDLLKYKKQIILQGPPGTGKTRQAKQIAKVLLNIAEDENLKNSEQFQIIQFHPSYSYEDFVRGIVAKPNASGITYEAENKILGKFAQKALDCLSYYQEEAKKNDLADKFIIHLKDIFNNKNKVVISENFTFTKFEENNEKITVSYNCRKNDRDNPNYISDFKKSILEIIQNNFEGKYFRNDGYWNDWICYLKQYAMEQIPFVLIIDEINRANLSSVLGELIYALEYRGEAVDSMYEVDGSNKIILPPNLYIIGTMNTADRSVGHIDYAIRRRFAFVDVLPRDISSEFSDFQQAIGDGFDSKKFEYVEKLFDNHLSQEFKKEEVQLGHSYFITEKIKIKTRLEYEIKPILREYVKDGILKESAREDIEKL